MCSGDLAERDGMEKIWEKMAPKEETAGLSLNFVPLDIGENEFPSIVY